MKKPEPMDVKIIRIRRNLYHVEQWIRHPLMGIWQWEIRCTADNSYLANCMAQLLKAYANKWAEEEE